MTRPIFEPGRYITLMGDPIGPRGPKPLLLSLPKRTEVQVAVGALGLTALFNKLAVQATGLISEEAAEMGTLRTVTIGNLVAITMTRVFEKHAILSNHGFKKTLLDTKCIDTKPGPDTPPSTDKYGLQAQEARGDYGIFAGVCAFLYGFSAVSTGSSDPLLLASGSGQLTRIFSGYRRFDNIAKGKWQIVDMPEPEKAPEVQTQPKLAALTA